MVDSLHLPFFPLYINISGPLYLTDDKFKRFLKPVRYGIVKTFGPNLVTSRSLCKIIVVALDCMKPAFSLEICSVFIPAPASASCITPSYIATRRRSRAWATRGVTLKRKINSETNVYVVVNFLSQVIFIFLLFHLFFIITINKNKRKTKITGDKILTTTYI